MAQGGSSIYQEENNGHDEKLGQGDRCSFKIVIEVVVRVCQEDPVQGKWCVSGPELGVWFDTSSLATGV